MIGFIMMYYDTSEENEYGDDPCYGILRFMIDRITKIKVMGKGQSRKQ
ncbi:hypothetical protein [Ornithinibacillus sp. JPR2-1]